MKRICLYLLGSTLLGALLLALVSAGYVYWAGTRNVESGAESFLVQPGSGVRGIAARLVEAGILAEPYTFTLWTWASGESRHLHAGEYAITPDTSVRQLLRKLVEGQVIQRSVTLIEGWTFNQFRAALYDAAKLKIETRELDGGQIMARLEAGVDNPEGRFFPDTYLYTAGTSDLDILRRARLAMREVLDEEWRRRDPDVAFENRDQALILASIIEKETGRAGERRTISAVFHNRLRRGMRLQTDPTVIYGLGDDFDGNLTRAHLRDDTPYNTYTRAGLPPTPIAMPGRAAIHAALNPGASEALYFVARGDGSHQFSRTLKAHNRAVNQFQRQGGGSGDE